MERELWKSKIGFLAAAIGSAVGIGNIWRFPYIVSISGGGSFLIPYLICTLIFGIPLLIIELATGRRFRGSTITTFERINPKFKFLSFIPTLVVFIILCYYLVVVGWILGYFTSSISNSAIEFSTFSKSIEPTVFSILSLLILTFIVMNGVSNGIEKVSKIMMPLFFVLLIILLLVTLSIPNSIRGILYYFRPDFSKLTDVKVWLLAAGQVLFSLSAGYGIMLTYGSYLKRNEHIPSLSILIAVADTLVAIFAGIIIFGVISSFNLRPTEGPHLAFVVLPKVFESMRFGSIYKSIFFLLLFIAGITSAVSMKEVVISNMIDEFGITRTKAMTIVTPALTMLMLLISLNYSGFFISYYNFLSELDMIFGNLLTLISATVVCAVIAWGWNSKELLEEVDIELEKISKWLDYFFEHDILLILVKFIIPICLVLLFLLKLLGFIQL